MCGELPVGFWLQKKGKMHFPQVHGLMTRWRLAWMSWDLPEISLETGEKWADWFCTKSGAVVRCGDTLYMEVIHYASLEDRKKLLTEWYRQQMQQAVPEVLARCEARMGLHANEWRIRDMKTRWGTCNIRERRIWLSLHLAKYPPQCLEGVITHELVHLLERGHNKRFYHFMDLFYPDWRTVKKMLAERKD